MKHIRKFNESKQDNILSMDDVKNLIHNLDHRKKNDFMRNYGWDESTKLNIGHIEYDGTWDGKKVIIYGLYVNYEIGYAVSIDGDIKYLVGIYEPHGCSMNTKRGLLTFWGHEQIIRLWLDDGEFEEDRTR